MSLIDWLNNNSGAVMALLTAVYVLGTVIICYLTWRAQKIATDLHKAIHRPVVVCDFVTQHSILYFRVRNLGNRSAQDVHIKVEETPPLNLGKWSEHPIIKNGVHFLSPGSEMVSLYAGSAQQKLPTVEFCISYTDSEGTPFAEEHTINLEAWLREDLGRENNDPVVKELRKIGQELRALGRK